MKQYTPTDWYNLIADLYELILAEISNISVDDLPEIYPKLVVMYEFFRLARGEAFYSVRLAGIDEFQEKIYKMENNLADHFKILAKGLNSEDDKTKHYLDLMKKSFDLKHFNQ